MKLLFDFDGIDHSKRGSKNREEWYSVKPVVSDDLESLLKVKSEEDALELIKRCGPLYPKGKKERALFAATDTAQIDEAVLKSQIHSVMNAAYSMRRVMKLYIALVGNKLDGLEHVSFENRFEQKFVAADPRVWPLEPVVECSIGFEFFTDGWPVGYFSELDGKHEEGKSSFTITGKRVFFSDSEDANREAFSDALSSILESVSRGSYLSFSDMHLGINTNNYGTFLWLLFIMGLINNNVRTCPICGDPFLANIGDNLERGSNPKTYCGKGCRATAVKARKAVKLIKGGRSVEEAAKSARIRKSKLELYLELNPNALD